MPLIYNRYFLANLMLNISFQLPRPTDGLTPMQEYELENGRGGGLKEHRSALNMIELITTTTKTDREF